MKKATKLLLIFIILTVCTSSIFGQAPAPNFSGTWILNFEKSKLEDKEDGLTEQTFIIKQEGDNFSLTIYHMYGDKKKKINFSMLADGKTRKVKMIFKGKLEQNESGLQATMWRKNYLNIVNYKFGANRNELVADEVFTGSPRKHHSIWVFDREVAK